MLVTLTINGKKVKAEPGTRILWAALDNGIHIPNLCAIKEAIPALASCRLCLVEIEGQDELVAACAEPVSNGMVVHTDSLKATRVRRTAFELIMSNHPVICAKCPANRKCGLQDTAKALGVKLKQKRFRDLPRNYPSDDSHPRIRFNPNLCILCGKCVWVCNEHGSGALNFAFRGMETMVSTFRGIPLKDATCDNCGECAAVCPVGALTMKSEARDTNS
jgi:formate dehydrogenase major subunit/NADH-quinone oxidoreductase subunit G